MCQKRKNNISKLRKVFFDLNIHAIIIPSADPHQSEYLAEHWKLREWISGFSGSAGTVVITDESAGLWTDSRYFLQAEEELEGSEFKLFRQGEKEVPTITQYLKDTLPEKSRIALNPGMWSQASLEQLKEKLEQGNLSIVTDHTPAEDLWNTQERPSLPTKQIFIHSQEYAGSSINEKLSLVREAFQDHKVDQHLITTLDDIAWLFNLRGYDISFNPVFMSYAIVNYDKAILFIDPVKVSPEVRTHLDEGGVITHPYSDIENYLEHLSTPVLVNKEDCNHQLFRKIKRELIVDGPTITRLLKACKTPPEIKQIDAVMIKDGLALARSFSQLHEQLHQGSMTELQFANLIAKNRSEQQAYYGESFPAIIGYQANGAIVHYRPPEAGSAMIRPKGLLLCDSGGQYYNGTTDITRTIALGAVTEDQKNNYTRVLKGHIAIDQAVFPIGTTGGMLDILARQFLWKAGNNFGHGTGHGVGYFLNVHEPPQGISPGKGSRSTAAFEPGMLTSNEPGYYEDGAYGIRIENLMIAEKSEHEGFLRHRHVTLFPIDTTLLTFSMMTREEIDWINEYHNLVASKLLPHLDGKVAKWVRDGCKPI